MFTGIVKEVGKILAFEQETFLHIAATDLLQGVELGESIAVNGVCLTVKQLSKGKFVADVSSETLNKIAVENFKVGARVNLERALTLSDRLGGHLMQGHVDGVGKISAMTARGEFWQVGITVPKNLSVYMVDKGSIAVDGISLTINSVRGDEVELMIVPHTHANTCLGDRFVGSRVNLEADIIGKYVYHQLGQMRGSDKKSGLTLANLVAAGYGGVIE